MYTNQQIRGKPHQPLLVLVHARKTFCLRHHRWHWEKNDSKFVADAWHTHNPQGVSLPRPDRCMDTLNETFQAGPTTSRPSGPNPCPLGLHQQNAPGFSVWFWQTGCWRSKHTQLFMLCSDVLWYRLLAYVQTGFLYCAKWLLWNQRLSETFGQEELCDWTGTIFVKWEPISATMRAHTTWFVIAEL